MNTDGTHASLRTGTGVAVATLVLIVFAGMPVGAGSSSPARGEQEAIALLTRAMNVGDRWPFEGTRLVSAWSPAGPTSLLYKVRSTPEFGATVRTLGASVKGVTFYESHSSIAGRRRAGFTLGLLAEHYQLALAGTALIAGRPARVVEARRSDGSLAARFWLDRETGLMLRREVHGQRGRVVRVGVFVELRVGISTPANASVKEVPRVMPDPWRHQLRHPELASLRSRGWTLPRDLPGNLTLVEARRGVTAGREVVHLSYSDGLSMVSVFVQRGALAKDRLRGWRRTRIDGCCAVYRQRTIPRRAVWAGHGQVYTVVADAPPQMVNRVVTALPHEARSGRIIGQMGRGFSVMGAWLNPFG